LLDLHAAVESLGLLPSA